jgi:glycosyltransferase involved in cell wall biosynthesis
VSVAVAANGRMPAASIATDAYSVIADRRDLDAPAPIMTVVVPTRQRADMVRDTVEALFAQDTGERFEVIVVDNASTDETSRVLAELAEHALCDMLAIRMRTDRGPAVSRNAGIALARGSYIAFTDSDCIPSRRWLRACIAVLGQGFDVVQGRTEAPPWQRQPLFSHFIETKRADGSFSTSNVAYRADAIARAGGFDPACDYWEDVDLGWRVLNSDGRDGFAEDALVYHQVVTQAPLAWLLHARRLGNWPAKAARYPGFRQHLFLGVWVDRFHALLTLSMVGLIAARADRRFLVLALPYLAAFPFRHGLRGRFPPLKAAAHFARDCISFAALVGGSIRHRSVVL